VTAFDPNVPGARWRPVAGGDIHAAYLVDLADGRTVFVKKAHDPEPGMFEAEAAGLELLRSAAEGTAVGVPRVLGWAGGWLALERIELGRGDASAGRLLGEGLAAIHGSSTEEFGLDHDNWIGTLPQPNGQLGTDVGGAAFFAQRRLGAQLELGSRLGSDVRRAVEAVCARIDELLPVQEEAPALLHGDLWGGNWTADSAGTPWIYDPAVFYGCREAELSFTLLFGGFPPSFYESYEGAFPLLPGWRGRVDLWNLYPLLVHANLFGGGYGSQVLSIARRYV
jgi:fructosamine-3-kinase